MRPGATWLVASRVFGRRRWSTVVVVVLLVVSAGTTMALVAGGRRASTSYDRFLRWTDGADAITGGVDMGSTEATEAALTQLASLPAVRSAARLTLVAQDFVLPDGQRVQGSLNGMIVDPSAPALGRGITVHGRLPDLALPGEAAVSLEAAQLYDLSPGDHLGLVLDSEQGVTGPVADITVVGVLAYSGMFPSLDGRPTLGVFLTEAFGRLHPERMDPTNVTLVLDLHDGSAGFADLQRQADAAGLSTEDLEATSTQTAGVNRLVRVVAGVLWLAAAVVALAGFLLVAQVLRREVLGASRDLVHLHELGWRRREIAAAGALRGVWLGGLSALGAIGVAIALSPVFPVGIARLADPANGFHADLVVLGVGVLSTIAVAAGLGALVAGLRPSTHRLQPSRGRAVRVLAERLPPGPATGARLALRRGAGGAGLIGLVGLSSVLALVLVVTATQASFARVLDRPVLSGATWDLDVNWDEADPRAAGGDALARDPAVLDRARGGWSDVLVNGVDVFSMIVEPSTDIFVVTDRGRSPSGPDEIALGRSEMSRLGVGVGDRVEVATLTRDGTPKAAVSARVVGRSVLASPVYRTLGRGEGAGIPLALWKRAGGVDVPGWFVRLRPPGDVQHEGQAVAARVPHSFVFYRADRAGIETLGALRRLPNTLIALLAVLFALALIHRLVGTVRSSRRDTAALRALGLTSGQLSIAGVVMGTLVGAVAVVVAVPLGFLASRPAWRWLATFLGVVPEPVFPRTFALALAVLVAAAGVIVGIAVLRRERRRSPGVDLRTE